MIQGTIDSWHQKTLKKNIFGESEDCSGVQQEK